MYNNYKVNAIIQARMTSSRLPGKVLLPLADKPVLQHIIERLRRSKYIDDVIVACTTNEADNPIIDLCQSLNCSYYRGSEDDVLSRVLEAAKEYKTDIIVEVTADCYAIDSNIVDECMEGLDGYDYCSNVIHRTYPRGLDTQAFWTKTLEKVNNDVDNPVDRQHVSSLIYKNPKFYLDYKKRCLVNDKNYSKFRLTLDTKEDYELAKFVYEAFKGNDFNYQDIVALINNMPEMFEINQNIVQKKYYDELINYYSNVLA